MSIAEVDALFGPAMGRPKTAMFKTADLVGLDVLGHVAQNTYDLVPDDEARDHFILPDFYHKMIENKLLGKKTQAGFYKTDLTPEWEENPHGHRSADHGICRTSESRNWPAWLPPRPPKTLPEKMQAIVFGEDKGAKFAWQAVADNLIYAANRIPEISDTIVEIDNAMKWGFNFRNGTFRDLGCALDVKPGPWNAWKRKASTFRQASRRCWPQATCPFIKWNPAGVFYYDFANERVSRGHGQRNHRLPGGFESRRIRWWIPVHRRH